MKKFSVVFAASVLFTVAACSSGGDEGSDAAETEASSSAETTEETKADAAGGAYETGVAECDDYIAKVQTCVNDKAPPEAKAALEKALEDAKSSWASVTDKEQLAQTCKAATEQVKAGFSAMGCEF